MNGSYVAGWLMLVFARAPRALAIETMLRHPTDAGPDLSRARHRLQTMERRMSPSITGRAKPAAAGPPSFRPALA
jgi:hypothetical protein